MFEQCRNMKDIMITQKELIDRHIDQHMWYTGIDNKDEAIYNFLNRYGWIMREFYCTHCCRDKSDCGVCQDLIQGKKPSDR